MILRPEELAHRERYNLIIGSVLPRPIAWVSTVDVAGNPNLAPFSYFTPVCATPMTLIFCPGVHSDGRRKDTWHNIEQVPEFVINVTNEETAAQMNLTATTLPKGQSEFDWAGVTPVPSEYVRAPRVAEAPVSFECRLKQIVQISDKPGGGAAVFGEVVCIHIREELYSQGRVDLSKLHPIGRLSGSGYTRITDTFEMKRVPPPDV